MGGGTLTEITCKQYLAWYFLGRKPPSLAPLATTRGAAVVAFPIRLGPGYDQRTEPGGPDAASHEEAGYSIRV